MIKNKIFHNISWIVGCRIVQAVISLVISMLTARYLGPGNYGLINYAASVVALVTPLMQLGINNVLVHELVEHEKEEGKIVGTALTMTFASSLLCVLGVISFSMIANRGERDIILVCALYSLLLIAQSIEITQYWFQAHYLAKYTAVTTLVAFGLVSVYRVILLVSGMSVYWFAVSQAIDYFLIAITLLVIYRKLGGQRLSFSFKTAKGLFRVSRHYIISGMMVTIFAQTDKIMLKLMIGNEETGFYSTAVACATITGFVFVAIIDSVRPLIFESRKKSKADFEKYLVRLYSAIIFLSLAQSVFMTLLAGPIIKILYGSAYLNSVNLLRIVVWFTTFSYMGSVRNIWILAEGKQKYLWMVNLMGALLNVILNAITIPYWGAMGAATASLVTQFFTNVITGIIIRPISHNNRLVLRSLNPKHLRYVLRSVLRKTSNEADTSEKS